jgi:hypothetical protein
MNARDLPFPATYTVHPALNQHTKIFQPVAEERTEPIHSTTGISRCSGTCHSANNYERRTDRPDMNPRHLSVIGYLRLKSSFRRVLYIQRIPTSIS